MQPGALVVGPMIYWLCWVSVIKFEGLEGEHKEIKGKIKKYGEMCVFKIAHHKIHIKHNEQQFVCGSVAEKKQVEEHQLPKMRQNEWWSLDDNHMLGQNWAFKMNAPTPND